MIIPDILLAVCVLILVWRVWRLEYKLRKLDLGLAYKANADWVSSAMNETLSRCTAATEQRVRALATALGYEWKRTEAKEGWEKKPVNPFGFKPLTGEAREEAIRSIEHAINTTPNPFCSARIRYYESGDRRKADRRKPTPQAAPQAPRKKPRRAH